MRLAARRMRAHLPLFLALLGVAAVIAGFTGGITGFVATASAAGVREGYAASTGDDGSLRIEVRDAGPEQDAAVRAVIAEQFAGVPLLVERTLQTDAVSVGDTELVLASLDLRPRATLVSGTWPTGAGEVLVGSGVELEPGAPLLLPGGVAATVAGTWRPTDPLDPYWFGADTSQLVVVDDSVFANAGVTPLARWTVTPDATRVEPAQLDILSQGALALPAALDADDAVGSGNIVITGGLVDWTDRLRATLGAVAGIAPVPVLVAAIIGLVALGELARLLVGVRVAETALLRSRGASALRLTRDAAAEAALAAVPGAALGTVVAGIVSGSWPWIVPLAVVVGAVGIVAVTVFLDARAPARRETAHDSGRGRRVASLGLVVLVLAGAAISTWQFLLYGSPVVRSADGRSGVDPVAVLAPALVLVAWAVLAIVLFAAASTLVERAVRRRGRIGGALAARQVARRAAVFTTPVLLVSLAAGGVTVAASYSATWSRATETALQVGNGAAVRVVTSQPASTFENVDAATPVLATTVQFGDDPVALLSLAAGSVEAVVSPAGGAVDPSRLATALATPTPAVPIPVGTRELEVRATAPTLLWIADESGRLISLRPGDSALPEGGRWSILAADVAIDAAQATYDYRLESISAEGTALDLGAWQLASDALPLRGEATLQGVGFVATLDVPRPGTVRLLPEGDPDLPLVVSQSFADRVSVAVGDELTLRFEGSGRQLVGTVSDVAAVVPGTTNGLAVAADLTGLLRAQLVDYLTVPQPNEVWVATDDPSAVSGARVTTAQPRDSVLATGRDALWIGSLGGLVLAIAAVAAITGALLRGRSGEVVVLRVVGLTARQQAASRRRELLAVLAYAVVLGVLGGLVTSVLVVRGLARAAVLDPPASLETVLRLDVVGGAVALAAFLIALVVIAVVYAAGVARQARTLSAREEVR